VILFGADGLEALSRPDTVPLSSPRKSSELDDGNEELPRIRELILQYNFDPTMQAVLWFRISFAPPTFFLQNSLTASGGRENLSFRAAQGEKLLTARSAFLAEFTLYRPILSKAVDCAYLVRICNALFSRDKSDCRIFEFGNSLAQAKRSDVQFRL
jgi:hypothetical protein